MSKVNPEEALKQFRMTSISCPNCIKSRAFHNKPYTREWLTLFTFVDKTNPNELRYEITCQGCASGNHVWSTPFEPITPKLT